jgi:hypothetical protein
VIDGTGVDAAAAGGAGVIDGPDGLTPAWVTSALRAGGRDVTVQEVTAKAIGTGKMGANYRLTLTGDGALPATLVAKVAAGSPEARKRVSTGYVCEVRFYQELAPLLTGANIPACWYAAINDDGTEFTLLLEDLAPREPGEQKRGCTPEQAADALVTMAGVHAPLWNSPLLRDRSWLRTNIGEAAEFLGTVLVDATEKFLVKFDTRLSAADQVTMRAAAAAMGRWLVVEGDTQSLVHGDFRLDNLMFPPAGPGVAIVDWQSITVGPPGRDVGYFLATSVEPDQRRRDERELISRYSATLKAAGVDYPADVCFEAYRLGVLQSPMITVLGCIYATSDATPESDEMFLAMTRRTCDAIRDLHTLDLIPA